MKDIPQAALVLGFAGLIPFLGLGVLAHLALAPWDERALIALVPYAAIILSFMGGCRWGFACGGYGSGPGGAPTVPDLAIAVAPALYAWGASLAPDRIALALLAAGLGALYAADVSMTRRGGAPAWWPRLRAPLSAGATAGCLIGALA